jgi:glucoamylase
MQPPQVATTTADRHGAFSVRVPVGLASNVITVAATTAKGTGVARVTVSGQLTGGFVVDDPTGDDNGPGTYQYPTAADFKAGSFDLTRFQVITKNGTVYLITTVRNLAETFGQPNGAQLLDLYVRDPAQTPSSTAAAFPQRNYTIAASDAWTQRIEVQAFASPVWVDANGNPVGSAQAIPDTGSNAIIVAVPQAQFGTPSSGWVFTVALTGQDGFSPDQARAFAPTPQPYAFGVCAPGGTAPICSADPNTVAKVMDTITPPGGSQSDELDVTKGPAVLHGVSVP